MHLEASFVRGDLPSALVETGLGLQKSESLGASPTGSPKPMFLEASDTPRSGTPELLPGSVPKPEGKAAWTL